MVISTHIVMSCYVNTVSQRVLLIKFKVVNYIFYSFYQNNAIGFNCLRSRFHFSRLFYSKFSIGESSYKVWMQEEGGSGVLEM